MENIIFCVVARQNHELLNDIKYFVRLYLVMQSGWNSEKTI